MTLIGLRLVIPGVGCPIVGRGDVGGSLLVKFEVDCFCPTKYLVPYYHVLRPGSAGMRGFMV